MNNRIAIFLNDAALDTVSGGVWYGAEVSMIELQSLVSQQATALQTTINVMRSINDGMRSVAGNIGR